MMNALRRNVRYCFTNMEELYYAHPNKTAVVFGPTNKAMTYRDLITQAKALARGLQDINFIKDDIVIVKLPYENMQQSLITRMAVSCLGGKVLPSRAKTISQLQKQFRSTKARAFVFSSFDTIEDTNYADALYRLLPEMVHAPYNSEIFPRDLKFLRFLIQTDNYKYKGTMNYNKLMKFLSSTEYNIGFECQEEAIKLERNLSEVRPIVLTNPSEELAFRAGVLNCLLNGQTLFCVKPSQAKLVSEQFQHQIDVICTEPLEQLHRNNRVYVERGSKLYERHQNRVQVML